jgi:hypothetical protein
MRREEYCSFCGIGTKECVYLYRVKGIAAICRRCASKALAELDPRYAATLASKVVPLRPAALPDPESEP